MIILALSYILTAVQVCKEYEIEVAQLAIEEDLKIKSTGTVVFQH